MKNYILFLVLLMLLSSCIKVEDIKLNPKVSTCGLAENTFVLSGYSAASLNFSPTTHTVNDSYYRIFFSGTGNDFAIYFVGKPTSGVYKIIDNLLTAQAGQCTLDYYGSTNNYYGYSGDVIVSVSGSKISLGFCSVEFSNTSYNYVSCSGYFVGA